LGRLSEGKPVMSGWWLLLGSHPRKSGWELHGGGAGESERKAVGVMKELQGLLLRERSEIEEDYYGRPS